MDVLSWKEFVAGWAGGVAGLGVGHPADTIKVRQQAFTERIGVLKTLRTTLKYEGVRGLYKGMLFPLLSSGALNALFFGVYANTLRFIEQKRAPGVERRNNWGDDPSTKSGHPNRSTLDVFAAGCVGGLFACTLACPIDLIKIQMQSQTGVASSKEWGHHVEPKHKGMLDCIRRLCHKRGVRGLYTGMCPMLLRDVVSYGVYMTVYETGLQNLHWNPVVSTLVSGGCAGVVSWGVIIPIDLVKSRIQADDIKKPMYRGVVDCVKKSYQAHGLPVFFRGFSMMMVRSFPVNAATFLVYESTLHLLKPDMDLSDLGLIDP
ncbi:solute carrier family 25 member 45-like [Thrips palmi]|uniref:Solute carrier family 25 member 45-like n=1 Tax=Thrips palmi TaxID=161013 RepID=A0A6P8ZHI7_THRPL|nr:solute carrier family 25 member 45-like [Thrips palmi]